MRVTEVKYRRTKQVAKFEPEQITLTVELDEGDTVADAIKRARITVAREFGELPTHQETQEAVHNMEQTLSSLKQGADELEHSAFE